MTPDKRYETKLKRAFPGKTKNERHRLARIWKEYGLDLPDTRKGYPPEKVRKWTPELIDPQYRDID